MPLCMIYLIPETNQIATINIQSAIDNVVTINSKSIINPNGDDKYCREVTYTEIFDTIPLSYENITSSITTRVSKGKK